VKTSNCYHCGSDQRTFYATENGFSLMKCSICGLLYVAERPDDVEISQAHQQGLHRGQEVLTVTGQFMEQKIQDYLGILADLFEGEASRAQTWLDVGCGHGEFVAAVQAYSQQKILVIGSEPNQYKQQSARDRGLNVTYFDLGTHPETYDVISLLNVYSHLPNPPEFFTMLKRCLNPGGELIIETGDTADFSAKEHHRPFSLPDHLSFASEKIVVSLLEQLNFEILTIRKYPYVQNSPKAIVKELIKFFLPHYQSRLLYHLNCQRYSQTDMYIRARLKG
jgi:SAM-dependent methyltransferase